MAFRASLRFIACNAARAPWHVEETRSNLPTTERKADDYVRWKGERLGFAGGSGA